MMHPDQEARGEEFEPESVFANPSAPSSAMWIRRAQEEGGQSVWGRLHDRYHGRLLLLADAVLGSKLRRQRDPVDVVQEAWMRALRSLDDFEYTGSGSFHSWLCLQVRRVAAEWGRKGGQSAARQAEKDSVSVDDVEPTLEDSTSGPASIAARRDVHARLLEALESPRIPEVYREVLIMSFLEELPRDELAERLGRKPNTISHQVTRGLQKWKEILGGDDPARLLDS